MKHKKNAEPVPFCRLRPRSYRNTCSGTRPTVIHTYRILHVEINVSRIRKFRNYSFVHTEAQQCDTTRHDTVYLCALKSWRKGQFNLAHDTKNRGNRPKEKKTKNKKGSSEETARVIVREGSPRRKVRLRARGKDFVKQVGFKP